MYLFSYLRLWAILRSPVSEVLNFFVTRVSARNCELPYGLLIYFYFDRSIAFYQFFYSGYYFIFFYFFKSQKWLLPLT